MIKKQTIAGVFSAGLFFLAVTTTTNAALLGRLPATPGGTDYQAYYDTTLDITWLADANLAASNTFGLPYNTDLGMHPNDNYSGTYSNTILTDGRMSWGGGLHWIDAMNASNGGVGYLGYNDWRLPSVDTSCMYYNCTGSEMGSLFYDTLGVSATSSILTGNPTELAKFTNVQSNIYLSGAEFEPYAGYAWYFNAYLGNQDYLGKYVFGYAWAVRSGDVSAVPVPAAVWLFGSGLIGLLAVARRRC